MHFFFKLFHCRYLRHQKYDMRNINAIMPQSLTWWRPDFWHSCVLLKKKTTKKTNNEVCPLLSSEPPSSFTLYAALSAATLPRCPYDEGRRDESQAVSMCVCVCGGGVSHLLLPLLTAAPCGHAGPGRHKSFACLWRDRGWVPEDTPPPRAQRCARLVTRVSWHPYLC